MPIMLLSKKLAPFLFIFALSIVGAFSVYFVLHAVFIPENISIPLAMLISLLIFSLTRYYSVPISISDDSHPDTTNFKLCGQADPNHTPTGGSLLKNDYKNRDNSSAFAPIRLSWFLFFVGIYSIMLAVTAFSNPADDVFIKWNHIGISGIIQLAAAIMLAFFLPGYSIMLLLLKKCRNHILRIIVAYLISILVTGLTAHFLATSFDVSISQFKNVLTIAYIAILVGFIIIYCLINKSELLFKSITEVQKRSYKSEMLLELAVRKIPGIKKELLSKSNELIVFAGLFSILVIFTYYTYGGITIGDQWYHQGRAITISSGSFRQAVLAGLESEYPPFQSALIAGFTSLSGIPIVNSYASIAFLSIIPLFAFYYFYSNWIPPRMRKSTLLACTLFVLASGFGWIYLTNITYTTSHTMFSEHSAIETIDSLRAYILMPSNFILASHPDFSTALIYIALPAGLVLLGICRQLLQSSLVKISVIAIIAAVGILSHEEFYFFIIVGSLSLVIFRIKEASSVYAGFLISLATIAAINSIAPQNYYLYTEIFAVPLLYLCILFVSIIWIVYIILHNFHTLRMVLGHAKKLKTINILQHKLDTGINARNQKTRFFLKFLVISIAVSVYVLSYVIVVGISPHEVNEEALRGAVSWYQYPMKFGLMGLLGLAFILSYLFKKFEKQIFVFGIIIVIALLTGPYYDEHRFSKYVMIGMIGFASLLLFRLLHFKCEYSHIVNPIIITAIIITASLSTLIFVGYNSLAFQNHEYVHDLGRRNFPADSEFKLLDAVRTNLDADSGRYNVISTHNEYNFFKGTLLTKLSSFDGIPPGKLLQGRFVLNVTTLDALYRLLDYSDARFIIIPKEDIMNESRLTQPVRFALDAFPHYYDDSEYVVLEVPPLVSPTWYSGNEADVALVIRQKDSLLPYDSSVTTLHYDNLTFNSNLLMNGLNVENNTKDNNNNTRNVLICSKSNKVEGKTVWYKDLSTIAGSETNYAEADFRMMDEYDNKNWTDAGLRWKEGHFEYYASISKNGLELYQISISNDGNKGHDKKLVYQNSEVEKKAEIWYNLKVASLQNSINVYVDDLLKVRVPRNLGNETNNAAGISAVGASCFNNPTEFRPVNVGVISDSSQFADMGGMVSNDNYAYYYYPLSILALSESSYDTFIDSDLSALSKKTVVLSFDPLDWDNTRFQHYIEYVNHGGTLVVINSENNFNGRFSHLFSVKDGDNNTKIEFTDIRSTKKEDGFKISGVVKDIHSGLVNASTIASYSNNSDKNTNDSTKSIIPFAFEKNYPSGGKIILINPSGYFESISKSKSFASLGKIPDVLGLSLRKNMNTSVTSLPPQQFVGGLDTTGNVKLRSTSLILHPEHGNNTAMTDNNSYGYNIHAGNIAINGDKELDHTFTNAVIKNLILVGEYTVEVDSPQGLTLPYLTSQHNYLGMLIPPGANVTINLSQKPLTYASILLEDKKNQTFDSPIRTNGSSIIKFYNVQTKLIEQVNDTKSKSIPTSILLKNPEIEVSGNTKFSILRFDWHFLENIKYNVPHLKAKLDFIDNYSESNANLTKVKYITFMNNTNIQ